MKLFVWPHVEALAQYADGEVYAFARTLEEALAEIKEHDENVYNEVRYKEPAIHSKTTAYLVYGSA